MFKCRFPEKYRGNPTNICWRSSWELKLYTWLDNSSEVEQWSSEEVSLPYFDKSRGHAGRYYPDAWVKFKNGYTFLVEVKPYKETIPPVNNGNQKRFLKEVLTYAKNHSKWEAAQKFCAERGWHFLKMTEKELGLEKINRYH